MRHGSATMTRVVPFLGIVILAGVLFSPLIAIVAAFAFGIFALLLFPELGVAYVGYMTVLPALPLLSERFSSILVVISGCGALAKYHFSPIAAFVRRCGPGVLLLGLMCARALVSGEGLYAQAWLKEILLVALTTYICVNGDGRRIVRWLAAFGVAAIILNYVLGSTTATGLRWAGLAGNPNKLGFFVVVSIPFIATLASRKSVLGQTALQLAVVGAAGAAVLRTLSIQSSVILLLAAGLTAIASPRLGDLYTRVSDPLREGSLSRRFIQLLACSSILYLLGVAMVHAITDLRPTADFGTFSGRSSTWSAGLASFVKHPLLGVGGVGRIDLTSLLADPNGTSIPNTALSLCVQAGFAALLLGSVLVISLARAVRRAPMSVASIAVYVVAAFSMVQAVQLYDLTWVVIGLSLGTVLPTPIAHGTVGPGVLSRADLVSTTT